MCINVITAVALQKPDLPLLFSINLVLSLVFASFCLLGAFLLPCQLEDLGLSRRCNCKVAEVGC